jgi:hypothetical protein
MDIGRQIGKQTSPIVVNVGAFNAMSETVNIIRKPHFDDRQFNVKQDQSGYYVSINENELTKDLTINNLPWMISNDENYIVSANNIRQIKILPGIWSIIGYDNFASISSLNNIFSARNAYTADPYWVTSVSAGSAFYICAELHRASAINFQYPTNINLTTYTILPTSNFPSYKALGYVENNHGVLNWTQYHMGNISHTNEPIIAEMIGVRGQVGSGIGEIPSAVSVTSPTNIYFGVSAFGNSTDTEAVSAQILYFPSLSPTSTATVFKFADYVTGVWKFTYDQTFSYDPETARNADVTFDQPAQIWAVTGDVSSTTLTNIIDVDQVDFYQYGPEFTFTSSVSTGTNLRLKRTNKQYKNVTRSFYLVVNSARDYGPIKGIPGPNTNMYVRNVLLNTIGVRYKNYCPVIIDIAHCTLQVERVSY